MKDAEDGKESVLALASQCHVIRGRRLCWVMSGADNPCVVKKAYYLESLVL